MGKFFDWYLYCLVDFEGIGIGIFVGLFRQIKGFIAYGIGIIDLDLDYVVLEGYSIFDVVDYLDVDLQVVLEKEETLIDGIPFLYDVLKVLGLQLIAELSHSSFPLTLNVIDQVGVLFPLLIVARSLHYLLVQQEQVFVLIEVLEELGEF